MTVSEVQATTYSVQTEFETFLSRVTGLSISYCNAAWQTIGRDKISSQQDARIAAYNFAVRFALIAPIADSELSDSEKLAIVQQSAGLQLNDLPEYVLDENELSEFLTAFNEHAEDCDLIRMDLQNQVFANQWIKVTLQDAAKMLSKA